MHFNIIHPSTPIFDKRSLSFRLSQAVHIRCEKLLHSSITTQVAQVTQTYTKGTPWNLFGECSLNLAITFFLLFIDTKTVFGKANQRRKFALLSMDRFLSSPLHGTSRISYGRSFIRIYDRNIPSQWILRYNVRSRSAIWPGIHKNLSRLILIISLCSIFTSELTSFYLLQHSRYKRV
jgi:hypothetical protein